MINEIKFVMYVVCITNLFFHFNILKSRYLNLDFFCFLVFFSLSTHLPSILLTHPCDTRNCLEISQGRTPWCANSTIRLRTTSGNGRPFTNTPPNWLTPPWPFKTTNKKTRKSKEFQNWWAKKKLINRLINQKSIKQNKKNIKNFNFS